MHCWNSGDIGVDWISLDKPQTWGQLNWLSLVCESKHLPSQFKQAAHYAIQEALEKWSHTTTLDGSYRARSV